MAFTLDIVDENEKLLIALSDVKPDEKLSALRERLIGETAFPRDYQFLVSGIALKPKQETKYAVGGTCGTSNKLQVRICVRRTPSPSTSYSDAQPAPFNFASYEPAAKKSKGQEKEKRKERKSDALRQYSESEIHEATGVLEKEKMRFFNKKLESLRSNQAFDSWGQEELRGVIEVSWTLEKTNLLKLTVKERIAAMPSSSGKTSDKEKQLLKGLEEVEMSDFVVKEEYKNFCVDLKEKGERHRDDLEKRFDEFFTKLKKAQANLKKSLEHNANPLEVKDETASVTVEHSMNVDLTEEERENLADKVKEEDEVMCDSSDEL